MPDAVGTRDIEAEVFCVTGQDRFVSFFVEIKGNPVEGARMPYRTETRALPRAEKAGKEPRVRIADRKIAKGRFSAGGADLARLTKLGLIAMIPVIDPGIGPATEIFTAAEHMLFRLAPIERNDERLLPLFHNNLPCTKILNLANVIICPFSIVCQVPGSVLGPPAFGALSRASSRDLDTAQK
jgi:hypothetical protein